MTLRDYFAGQALALLANERQDAIRESAKMLRTDSATIYARMAYELADSMLKVRETE